MKPMEPPYPRCYDLNAQSDYHAKAIGHFIENCPTFKSKVQLLLDVKWLSFEGMMETPNVMHNSWSNHNNSKVNAIEKGLKETFKREVFELKILMKFIFKTVLNMRFLQT